MTESTENKVQYAGFWIRVGAYVLDMLIFIIPAIVMDYVMIEIASSVFGGEHGHMNALSLYNADTYDTKVTQQDAILHYIVFVINCAIWVLVYKLFLTSNWQATPGKRLMNIYVVEAKGGKLSSGTAILRTSLPILICICFMLSISFRTVNVEKHVPTPDNNFVEEIKVIMPLTYDYFVNSKLDEVNIIDHFSFVVSLYPEIQKGTVKIKDAVVNLKFYEGLYGEEDIKIIEIMLEEYTALSQEDRVNLQQHVVTMSADALAEVVKIFLVVLLFCIMFFIWYIMVAFTKEKTAFHDIVAKTRVIKGRP